MSILLRYPTAAAPTTTITLNPTLVAIEPFIVRPLIRTHRTLSGKTYYYVMSSNTDQRLEMRFSDLHEADSGSDSGLTSLRAFLETTLGFTASFDLTDTDGVTTTVSLLSGYDSIRESGNRGADYQRFIGHLVFVEEIS